MENRVWRIFICCLLCAGIGTLISLEINHYFWWVGVLAGGFLVYLSYDFKKVITIAPKAWNLAKGCKIDWHKIGLTIKDIIVYIISIIGFSLNFFVPFALFISSMDFYGKISQSLPTTLVVCFICALILTLLFILGKNESPCDKRYMGIRQQTKSLLRSNFFRVYFYLLPKSILWCIKKTPYAIVAIMKGICHASPILAKFIKHLFILIHSEWRLLCAIDSSIGILVGYLCGNIFIGAIAGGVFGVLDYEIFSKRILKIAIAQEK